MTKTAEKTAVDAPAPDSPTLDKMVDQLFESIKGYGAKFNREQSISVVDLSSRTTPQGVKYRQLQIRQADGYISVALMEGFSSSHGGTVNTKTLYRFVVSVSNIEAYARLERRFFGYNAQKNADEGVLLLDELKRTIA